MARHNDKGERLVPKGGSASAQHDSLLASRVACSLLRRNKGRGTAVEGREERVRRGKGRRGCEGLAALQAVQQESRRREDECMKERERVSAITLQLQSDSSITLCSSRSLSLLSRRPVAVSQRNVDPDTHDVKTNNTRFASLSLSLSALSLAPGARVLPLTSFTS